VASVVSKVNSVGKVSQSASPGDPVTLAGALASRCSNPGTTASGVSARPRGDDGETTPLRSAARRWRVMSFLRLCGMLRA
jgi:hypothetical protein